MIEKRFLYKSSDVTNAKLRARNFPTLFASVLPD
jgi:hypothetical protein